MKPVKFFSSLRKSVTRILLIRVGLIASLMFLPLISAQPVSAAPKSEYLITHDDLILAFENYLSEHEIYSEIPSRIYAKRIMDSIRHDSPMEIRIIDRARGNILKSDNFQVTIMTPGKTIRRFELRGILGIEVPVAVASRHIQRGERIDDAIRFVYRDLSGSSVTMPIYEGDDTGDLVMRVNLQPGRELDMRLMEKPDIVFRNQKVIVFFEMNGLAVTMIGRALQNGKLGDRIDVLNESSGKRITCEVTGEGEVEAR